MRQIEKFRTKFNTLQMTIISFFEVDYSFDLGYLQKSLADTHAILKNCVQRHLTEKSINKIDEVFEFFNNPTLLEIAFRQNSPYRETMEKIVADLNKVMESEDI